MAHSLYLSKGGILALISIGLVGAFLAVVSVRASVRRSRITAPLRAPITLSEREGMLRRLRRRVLAFATIWSALMILGGASVITVDLALEGIRSDTLEFIVAVCVGVLLFLLAGGLGFALSAYIEREGIMGRRLLG